MDVVDAADMDFAVAGRRRGIVRIAATGRLRHQRGFDTTGTEGAVDQPDPRTSGRGRNSATDWRGSPRMVR
jgi:hypothetical protein